MARLCRPTQPAGRPHDRSPTIKVELVTAIDTPAGERLCALFVWVEGTVLQGALTVVELHNLGRSVATLHNIARQFTFPDATCDFRSGYCYDQALMLNHRDWIDKHRMSNT